MGKFYSSLMIKLGDLLAVVIYLIVFLVTVFDVIMRYLYNSPTVWGLELVIMLAGIHYILSGAGAIASDKHVKIDVLYNLMPFRVRLIMDVLAHLLMAVFLGFLFWFGYEQALPAILEGERTGAGWNSLAPTYMKSAIVLSAALMFIQAFVCISQDFQRIRHEW